MEEKKNKKHKKIKITPKEWNEYQSLKIEKEQYLKNKLLKLELELESQFHEAQLKSIQNYNFTFTNHKFALLPKVCDCCGNVIWLEHYITEQVYGKNDLHHTQYYYWLGEWNMYKYIRTYCLDCWREKNNI